MLSFRMLVDAATNTWRFKRSRVSNIIELADDTTIRPRSQQMVRGRINMVEGNVIVSPYPFSASVSVAFTVDSVKSGMLNLWVANSDVSPVHLHAGQKMATIESLTAQGQKQDPISTNLAVLIGSFSETVKFSDDLNDKQIKDLTELISKYYEAFSLDGKLGCTNVLEHSVELVPGSKPFAEPLRRRAHVSIDETRRQVQQMLAEGVMVVV